MDCGKICNRSASINGIAQNLEGEVQNETKESRFVLGLRLGYTFDPIKGDLEFNNVSFKYKIGEQVLTDFNLNVKAGQSIALVGHTGAGKTTITNLIMRFYDPKGGSILVDEQDLKQITLDTLYDQVSYVSQDPYLFAGTVIDNIRYGKPRHTGIWDYSAETI